MIAEGKSRSGARQLASHLLKLENESVKVLGIRGCFYDSVHTALIEMEERALLTNCSKPLYHAHLDWQKDEHLTDAQQVEAIDTLGRHLGLENQPVAIVQHVKAGRMHVHAVWSRIDLENERAISDSHNYRKHELASREIERAYGLERVQGAHIERDGPRPERGFEKWEFQQTKHSSGPDPRDFRQEVRAAWEQSDNGAAFRHALDARGMVLSNGDRRDSFVVVDRSGDIVALKTTTVGARAADIRAKLSDLDRSALLSVVAAKQQQELARSMHQQEATGGGEALPPIVAAIVPAIDTEPGAMTMIVQQSGQPDKARTMIRRAFDFLRQSEQAQGEPPARALTPEQVKSMEQERPYIEKSPVEKGFNIFESVAGGFVDMLSGNLNNGQGVEPYRTSSVQQTAEAQQLAEKQQQEAQRAAEQQTAEQKLGDDKLTAEQKQTEAVLLEQRQAPEQALQQPGMYAPPMDRREEAFSHKAAMLAAIDDSAAREERVEPMSQAEYDRQMEERRLSQDRGMRR